MHKYNVCLWILRFPPASQHSQSQQRLSQRRRSCPPFGVELGPARSADPFGGADILLCIHGTAGLLAHVGNEHSR